MQINNSNIQQAQTRQAHQETVATLNSALPRATQSLINNQIISTFKQTPSAPPHIASHLLKALNTQLALQSESPSSSTGFERTQTALLQLMSRLLEPQEKHTLSIPLTGKGLGGAGAGSSEYEHAVKTVNALREVDVINLKYLIQELKDTLAAKQSRLKQLETRVENMGETGDLVPMSILETMAELQQEILRLTENLQEKQKELSRI